MLYLDALTGVITKEGIGERYNAWGVNPAEFNSLAKDGSSKESPFSRTARTALLLSGIALIVSACSPSPSNRIPEVDCSGLIAAAQHHLDQLAANLPDEAVIAIRPDSLTNPPLLQQDLGCFFDKNTLQFNGLKAQDADMAVVDMVMTYKPADGQPQLTPVLAVFDPRVQGQELIPLVMFGERTSKEVVAVQAWPDRWEVKLSPVAVVQDGQVIPIDGLGLEPLNIVKQLDFTGNASYQIVMADDRNIPVSEADLGGLALGGWVLGAFNEAREQAATLRNQATEIGFMPAIQEAVGVPGTATGQTEGSFAPDRSIIDSLNGQGFMVVESKGGVLCFNRDDSKIPVVTEKVMDPQNPEKIYQLVNLIDGQVVPVVPGESPQVTPEGFVLYGEPVTGQWVVRQKELVVMPDVFPGLECVGVIVNDQSKIPQGLIDLGYQYYLGTKMFAIVDPSTGEILGLVPTIYNVGEQVTIGHDHGIVRLAVANGEVQKVFKLQVAAEKLIPPQPEGALGQYRGGPAILDSEDVPTYMQNSEKTAWVEIPLPEIWTDPATPEKYPVIDWEDITSGLFAKALHQAYERGEIPPFPDKAFNTGVFNWGGALDWAGFDGPRFSNHPDYYKYVTDPTTRPLRWVAYGVMPPTEGKKGRIILVQQILNSDGGSAFISYFGSYDVVNDPQGGQKMVKWVNKTDINFFPITQFKDKTACEQFTNDSHYCDWFLPNQDWIEQLAEEWIATGNVPKPLERMPFFGISRSW